MNPTTPTISPRRPKPRTTFHPSYIKPSSILHPMVRLSIKLKIRTNWGPTCSSTNHLIRGHFSNHPTIHYPNSRQLHPKHISNHPRTPLSHLLLLTPSHNMICINPS
uniref:Uncharacterized protein n=1 Tax=Cyanoderma ruficeps TaxID=181631 RepID=A0A8C3QZL5_9PASS